MENASGCTRSPQDCSNTTGRACSVSDRVERPIAPSLAAGTLQLVLLGIVPASVAVVLSYLQRFGVVEFDENMKAFREGRMEKNPADFWYKGEIGFFDFYIIPVSTDSVSN